MPYNPYTASINRKQKERLLAVQILALQSALDNSQEWEDRFLAARAAIFGSMPAREQNDPWAVRVQSLPESDSWKVHALAAEAALDDYRRFQETCEHHNIIELEQVTDRPTGFAWGEITYSNTTELYYECQDCGKIIHPGEL